MPRPVAPDLPDEGLLVGWSLEGEPRRRVFGFSPTPAEGAGAEYLEPILHTGEGHLITVAPTGAGKGVGCIIPALLRYRGPVIVIDPKGENYWVTARRRRELGQKVIALDPFRITGAPERDRGTFNPLDFLSPENPSLVEDAEMIATTLMSTAGYGSHEPFWPYMGGQLLTMLLLYQIRHCKPHQWTLTYTRELLARDREEFAKLGETLKTSIDRDLRHLAGVATNPADVTFGGYWAFSQMQTAFLKGKLVADCIATSSFSLQELVDGDPLSIYVVIPPEKLEAYGNLLKVWLAVMISALTHRRAKPDRPTLFILDEAAQLGPMPQLRQAITLLRGYGVRVWSFWQDLSQLQGLYPDTWPTILNNCYIQQFFGQVTRLGSQQTYDVTGLGSPEFLQSLEPREMVLSVLGDQPVIARVPDYRADPPFQGLYDENPLYRTGDSGTLATGPTRVFRRSDFSGKAERDFRGAMELARRLIEAQKRHPMARELWVDLDDERKENLLDLVCKAYEGLDDGDRKTAAFRFWPVSFYGDYDYYEVRVDRSGKQALGYFLGRMNEPAEVIFLDGSSGVIQRLNQRVGLKLKRDQVRDYLYFFCTSIQGEDGRFLIIDEIEDLTFKRKPDEEFLEAVEEAIRPVSPPKVTRIDGTPVRFSVEATVLYDATLFLATFTVGEDGTVEMQNDEPLFQQMPVVRDTDLWAGRLELSPRGKG